MEQETSSTAGPVAPPVTPQAAVDDPFDFASNKRRMTVLIDDWEPVREKTKENRKTRDVDFSVEVLRREGLLDEDETMIPVRIIDTNITREQPPYINYIKNSRRIAIFTPEIPDINTDKLELEFTKGMSYLGWENVHFKTVDGAATHGWDSCEVVYDSSKPLNVGVEHVGHDQLFWPKTARELQQAPQVIRQYDYSLIELQSFVLKFGWSAEQVQKIVNARKDGKKEGETCKIYKRMFKKDGVVYVAWFTPEDGTNDWLKAPAPLYIGIDEQVAGVDPMTRQQTMTWQKKPVTAYPYFILPYRESEKPKLLDKHGAVFLHGNKQEAMTAILSGFVNGLNRATNILASPKADDGTGNSVKEIANTTLSGGTILNKPMDFYNSPYPDFQILQAMQYLDTANSNETNQTNFAVLNREDSRKTAKEMSVAEQQSNLLNSVQLTLFSSHIRGIYSLCWQIVQSQALQGLVKFLLVNKPQPQINPFTRQPVIDPQSGQPVMQDNWVNDDEMIRQKYDIRAAGDVDVIQRNELIQQMKQDWPVIANTALAPQFLADLLRLSYPNKGDSYAQTVANGMANQQQNEERLIAAMLAVLKGFMSDSPEAVKALPADQQQQLTQMIQSAEQIAVKVTGGKAQS